MKFTGRLVVLCAAILFQGMALEAQGPSILDFPFEHQGAPCWISAEAVADAEKIVDFDLIRNEFLRQIAEKNLRVLGDRLPVEDLGTGRKPSIETIPFSDCESTRVWRLSERWTRSSAGSRPGTFDRIYE
jgi:hypothetical protein